MGPDLFVVLSADRDEVGNVGRAAVAMPLSYVVEFESMHGGSALEASSVPDRDHEPLGDVGKPSAAPQPEGPTLPVEDHPGEFGVRRQRCEYVVRYGTDSDYLASPSGVGTVHHPSLHHDQPASSIGNTYGL